MPEIKRLLSRIVRGGGRKAGKEPEQVVIVPEVIRPKRGQTAALQYPIIPPPEEAEVVIEVQRYPKLGSACQSGARNRLDLSEGQLSLPVPRQIPKRRRGDIRQTPGIVGLERDSE